jgi:prepilin-type N-terminal cleavage/methylation domain-containing protein
MKNFCKNKSGFTILELMIVISILAIVSLFVFTSQTQTISNAYLVSNANQIAQMLRVSQMKSVSSYLGSQWGLYFEDNNGIVKDKFIMFKGSSYSGRDVDYDIVSELPLSLTFTNVSFNDVVTYVVFDKLSGNTSNFGSLQLVDSNGETRTISINSRGIISNDR